MQPCANFPESCPRIQTHLPRSRVRAILKDTLPKDVNRRAEKTPLAHHVSVAVDKIRHKRTPSHSTLLCWYQKTLLLPTELLLERRTGGQHQRRA